MDNQPSFDRELLLPILLGGFSILGILIILLIGRLSAARASVIVVETETPFKYIFLGTEPLLSSETPEASGTQLLTDIPFDSPTPGSTVVIVTPALGTPVLLTPNNAGGPPPLNPGTYDDAHPSLGFSPEWASQTGVNGAYQETIHVSTVIGSSISFSFIGKELRVFYLGGSSLGEVTVTIDGQSFSLDQSDLSNGNEWISDPLTNNTHTVLINHMSGGSVNLDYVIVPEIGPTGTPTATATRTATGSPPSGGPPTGSPPSGPPQ